jgi:hypothetical protein
MGQNSRDSLGLEIACGLGMDGRIESYTKHPQKKGQTAGEGRGEGHVHGLASKVEKIVPQVTKQKPIVVLLSAKKLFNLDRFPWQQSTAFAKGLTLSLLDHHPMNWLTLLCLKELRSTQTISKGSFPSFL